jgi:peptide methionine sulfoxide reductase msrA/msrB
MWSKKKPANDAQGRVFPVAKSAEEWSRELTPEQYYVLRQHGTERPRSSPLDKQYGAGRYLCAGCDQELFGADTKFDSGTGWPSFFRPLPGAVETSEDNSLFTTRTEVHCARCGGHLGHVFPDGPQPTGERYCMNGVALKFVAEQAAGAGKPATDASPLATATFAAGCFWGVESEFRALDGVVDAAVGYTGGKTSHPTYEQVCADRTGHAEAVEVKYDPARISYEKLLEAFWEMHDPTTPNRQGPDIGSHYRSAVFVHDEQQAAAARAVKAALDKAGRFRRPIVTEIVPAAPFYRAEDYHQQYFQKRGVRGH